MKKIAKTFLYSLVLLTCITFAQTSFGQAPPPPPAEKGTNTNKAPGGGAPIDAGVYVVLALAAGFGAWKLFRRAEVIKS
jgi:hypothetical protein